MKSGISLYLPHVSDRERNFQGGAAGMPRAFRIALGNLVANIVPCTGGLLKKRAPVLLAGLDYTRPWTRDSAINTMNSAALLLPEVMKNSLLIMLENDPEYGLRIGGQYWDAVIWILGAWTYVVQTGDREFLHTALKAGINALLYFEQTEYDETTGLFRGAACYGDGVSAYPDRYAATVKGSGDIRDWAAAHPDERVCRRGEGLPMLALSTNCLYYQAYRTISRLEALAGQEPQAIWEHKAKRLRQAINKHLWNAQRGSYDYFIDEKARCEHQEGIGISFALLFGVADRAQRESIFSNVYLTAHGIPCVYPAFARYKPYGDLPRHAGTVWPHIKAFWGNAAARCGRIDLFNREMETFTDLINRDNQCTEIYHPVSGKPYGGFQESQPCGEIKLFPTCHIQAWSATAYISLVIQGLFGCRFTGKGLFFSPCVPEKYSNAVVSGLKYREAELTIAVEGYGKQIKAIKIDNRQAEKACFPADITGRHSVQIVMEKTVSD
ncbi:MAG TPA: amylo-alpha-1,6-glucosidase [Spirochaetota bacterium]|nr:amylo-alpha-1,6-glucosidase [Spirochaetota bacterium]